MYMSSHYDRLYCGKCGLTLRLDPETIKQNKAKMEAKKAAAAAAQAEKVVDNKADAGKKGAKAKGKK